MTEKLRPSSEIEIKICELLEYSPKPLSQIFTMLRMYFPHFSEESEVQELLNALLQRKIIDRVPRVRVYEQQLSWINEQLNTPNSLNDTERESLESEKQKIELILTDYEREKDKMAVLDEQVYFLSEDEDDKSDF